MGNKPTVSTKEELNLLRMSLLQNHLQELKDYSAAEVRATQLLHARHRQEMAQISVLFNPFGWAMAIRRYTRQLIETAAIGKFKRSLIRVRQAQETIELDKWIKHQQQITLDAQRDDLLTFDRLRATFGWHFSRKQLQYYYHALTNDDTIVVTDTNKSILWVSRGFAKMTGYNPVDILGKTPRILQGTDTNPTTVAYINEQLSQTGEVETELINYRESGEPYLCHLHIKPLRNTRGVLTHFIAVEHEVESGSVNTP